jgi:hypothetical protein
LHTINVLVNKLGKKNYKLLLKGLAALYQADLNNYFIQLKDNISEEENISNVLSGKMIVPLGEKK